MFHTVLDTFRHYFKKMRKEPQFEALLNEYYKVISVPLVNLNVIVPSLFTVPLSTIVI